MYYLYYSMMAARLFHTKNLDELHEALTETADRK